MSHGPLCELRNGCYPTGQLAVAVWCMYGWLRCHVSATSADKVMGPLRSYVEDEVGRDRNCHGVAPLGRAGRRIVCGSYSGASSIAVTQQRHWRDSRPFKKQGPSSDD
jgi:hypothetical protein